MEKYFKICCGVKFNLLPTRERVFLIGKTKQKLNITFHNPNTGDDLIQELIKVMALVAKSTVEKELIELSKDVGGSVDNNNIEETSKSKTKNDEITYVEDKVI